MTYEYTAYVSSGNVNSAEEVLRVTAKGEFIWHENADEMIESADYSQYPALRHILKALRENERLREELVEAEAVRERCNERAFRLESEVERLREALDNLIVACELPGDHCEVEQALPYAKAALQEQPR